MVKERESGQNEGLRSEEKSWSGGGGAYRREESVQSGGSNLGE
jgi:hypothetical protein